MRTYTFSTPPQQHFCLLHLLVCPCLRERKRDERKRKKRAFFLPRASIPSCFLSLLNDKLFYHLFTSSSSISFHFCSGPTAIRKKNCCKRGKRERKKIKKKGFRFFRFFFFQILHTHKEKITLLLLLLHQTATTQQGASSAPTELWQMSERPAEGKRSSRRSAL